MVFDGRRTKVKTFSILWENVFSKSKVLIPLLLVSCSVFAFSIVPIWLQKGYLDKLSLFLNNNYSLSLLVISLILFYLARCFSGGFLIPFAQAKDLYYEYVLTKNVCKSQHKMNNEILLEYYDSSKVFNLLTRTNETLTSGALRETFDSIAALLTMIISLVTVFISLYSLNSWFVVLSVISIIPIFIESFYFEKKMYDLNSNIVELKRQQRQSINHIIGKEYFLETRISGSTKYFKNQWENYRKTIETKQFKIYFRRVVIGLLLGLVKSSCTITIIIMATLMLSRNEITLGSFGAIFGILAMQNSYGSYFVGMLSKSFARYKELKEIKEYYNLKKENISGETLDKIGNIELKNVSFKYDSRDENAIDNININFKEGEKVAILGVNGAGKTTLVNIILGLYSPTEGTVKYNNIKIADKNLNSIRMKMTAIFQDYQIYCMSIAENVKIGSLNQDINNRQIYQALDNAGFNYEKREYGIESLIGKEFKGIELSKGEAQQLAIARVYINTYAEIIVIDEPTSALDPLAEEKLYKHLLATTGNKTTFFVSHRLSSVKIADRIIVMDSSKIIEDGSHQDLLIQNGLYAKMYNQQNQLYNQ